MRKYHQINVYIYQCEIDTPEKFLEEAVFEKNQQKTKIQKKNQHELKSDFTHMSVNTIFPWAGPYYMGLIVTRKPVLGVSD